MVTKLYIKEFGKKPKMLTKDISGGKLTNFFLFSIFISHIEHTLMLLLGIFTFI